MNRIVILAVLVGMFAFAWFSPAPDEVQLEDGYRSLFNGYSLDGWYKIGGESTFRADRGEIIGTHGPGENTFLRTEETFRDFSLKMEMRWDELGNSGVLFRAQQREDGRAYGYQYELDHSDRAWTAGIYDEARRGWLYKLEDNEAARNAVKLEDWNEVHIEARGPRLQTWINGVPAADVLDVFDAEGYIALQVHSGDIGIMRWRNIRLKELEPLGEPGEALDGRRQLRDFALDLELANCEQATTVQIRRARATGGRPQYVELELAGSSARARIQYPDVLEELEPVYLDPGETQRVRIAAQGQLVTISVGEQDVARLNGSALPDRGKLIIDESACGNSFDVGALAWTDLTTRNAEPLFYQTLDNAPAPVYSPEEALESFRIAPGFTIELVAAEPLVGSPVAMSWDEYGRLYVVEMRSYMPDAYGTDRGTPLGRVVRLEDTDGDGRMDTSDVFLDELTYPRAVAVANEGILIGEPPNLWLCELPTRDALCTNKRSLGEYGVVDGAAADANVEHLENKLLPGLDTWYYNSKSTRSLRIKDGKIESRHSLFRGQWGIGKDDFGRLYYNHNSNLITADFFAAEDLFDEPTYSVVPGLGEVLTMPEEVFSVRVNPGVNRAYLDGTLRPDGRLRSATSASGLTPYRGDQMPAAMQGQVFVAEPGANVVAQFVIEEADVALSAKHQLYEDPDWGQREFLASIDERFRPVDVLNGPDGALYIIDMYRGLIQDEHFLTEELREQVLQRQLDAPIDHGRIWRVTHTGGESSAAVAFDDAPPAALVAALSHENGWVRDTAQRLLLKYPGEQTPELREIAGALETLPAIHALWVLQGRGELDRDTVLAALRRNDPHRRVQALRAGQSLLSADDLVMAAGQSSQPRVQMQIAFALGEYAGQDSARAALLQLVASAGDNQYLRQAAVRSVQGYEIPFLAAILSEPMFSEPSEFSADLAAKLAVSAYASAREDMTLSEDATPELGELLSLMQAQTGPREWIQLAMLKGIYASVVVESGFKPVVFDQAPPIFADSSVDETSPLWDARLKGRRAFTWPGDEVAAGIKPLSPSQMALMEKGASVYPACGACHGRDGAGIAGLGPALAGSEWVSGAPEKLGRIILQGMDTERNGVMPPHAHLDDEAVAGLMLYLRRSWGNAADPVSVEKVAEIRETSAPRATPWTVADLERVKVDRGYGRFEGKYGVSFITMTVSVDAEGRLNLEVPMYGGGPLEEESEGVFIASLDGTTIRLEFEIAEDGTVPGFVLWRGSERIPTKRK